MGHSISLLSLELVLDSLTVCAPPFLELGSVFSSSALVKANQTMSPVDKLKVHMCAKCMYEHQHACACSTKCLFQTANISKVSSLHLSLCRVGCRFAAMDLMTCLLP